MADIEFSRCIELRLGLITLTRLIRRLTRLDLDWQDYIEKVKGLWKITNGIKFYVAVTIKHVKF